MLTEKTIKLLEFDKIREAVSEYAVSLQTKAVLLGALPSFDESEISRTLALTSEASVLLNKYLINPLGNFDDVGEILEKARIEATLDPGELLRVAKLLRSARIARSSIIDAPDDIVSLKDMVKVMVVDKSLEKDIFDSIISEHEISDRASDKLYSIRRKIANLSIKLNEKLASYTRNNDSSKYLQDNLVTVREGRYVLPVKAECRSSVPGLMHDRSATGSTVFIEPFAVVELNNELKFLRGEEKTEIERILREFTKRVALGAEQISLCESVCVILDIVLCKAKYSTKIKGVLPDLSTKKAIKLTQSRHPLIDKDKVVPVDLSLGGEYGILLITGPNTGGKTVSLKTVGLFCLMAYFGLFLPCTYAEISVFDNIFCDIGDEQSIENELSTFSSHVSNLKYITENVTDNSLVLLDEVGGGTDPEEGAALAVGILKYLELCSATAIITTHYGELKEYAMTTRYVENACMQFDESTLSPTYKLVVGMPGTSNALKIAKRLGLCEYVIKQAESALSEDKIKFEQILSNAEKIKRESLLELEETRHLKEAILLEKSQLEAKRIQLDATMERIKNNAAAETKRLVASSMERAAEIIDEMKAEKKRADEAALLRATKLRNQLEDINYSLNAERISVTCENLDATEIVPGLKVILKSLGGEGIVTAVNAKKQEAEVSVGSIKTKVAFKNLGKPVNTQKKVVQQQRNKPKNNGECASSGFSEREIMVLGKTVSEAIQLIEPMILAMYSEDDAKQLRIVHGKGTGALGKGIQKFLKDCPMIAEYRYGRYGEGDSGVTIATVK